jgi:hypothetical protein
MNWILTLVLIQQPIYQAEFRYMNEWMNALTFLRVKFKPTLKPKNQQKHILP